MTRRKLPIGLQSFRTIREGDFYYVDKTPLVRELVERGRFYFLSRPRRFGKSLLLDTLKALFEGKEELFRGLHIHPHWDWSIQHPVVRLSFDGNYSEPGNLHSNVVSQLAMIEEDAGLEPAENCTAPDRLQTLLHRLHRTTGRQVVVLVDEYDKPILDVLDNPDLAKANRDWLRGFYGIVKGSAEHVRFVFVTGVSMFSKVSLFSGLNNLRDITLDPRYATVCGYTDNDLDQVFAPELKGLAREEIRRWYNGYHWLGQEKVYNPFDVLLLFDSRKFKPWWFRTGSPSFLFQQLMDKGVSPMELERRVTDEQLVSKFDVGDISVDALLFQTGYLTLVEEEWDGAQTFYTLDYPNLEVRQSLNQGLLSHLGRQGKETSDQGKELARLLADNDFDGFAEHLRAFFAGIPYPWHSKGDMARYEAWYAGILYACFRTIGLDLRVEDASSRGRSDMVLLHHSQVFVLELKVARGEGGADTAHLLHKAIQQMQQRGYGEKYRHREEPIHLVALVFGWQNRNLDAVKAVRA